MSTAGSISPAAPPRPARYPSACAAPRRWPSLEKHALRDELARAVARQIGEPPAVVDDQRLVLDRCQPLVAQLRQRAVQVDHRNARSIGEMLTLQRERAHGAIGQLEPAQAIEGLEHQVTDPLQWCLAAEQREARIGAMLLLDTPAQQIERE